MRGITNGPTHSAGWDRDYRHPQGTLEELQHHVEGLIELCPMQCDGQDVWVNEEGRVFELAPNTRASQLVQHPLVGPVLILGAGEVVP